MNSDLLNLIRPGGIVLTATKHLAHHLRAQYALAMRESGKQVWRAAEVVPLDAWIQKLWNALTIRDGLKRRKGKPVALLLDTNQERLLWRKVIGEDKSFPLLLMVDEMARSAAAAWELQHAYGLEFTEKQAEGNEDALAFLRWSGKYRAICTSNGWTDAPRMKRELIDLLAAPQSPFAPGRAGEGLLPAAIAVAGFDSFTPLDRNFLDALAPLGCSVTEIPFPQQNAGQIIEAVECSDAEEEVRRAALWARALLERKEAARVGIVLPDLKGTKETIARIFSETLDPGLPLRPGERSDAIEFSLGEPLDRIPIIRAALDILEFLRGRIPVAIAGNVLRSPFLPGAEQERESRALLDARLRDKHFTMVSLSAIESFAGEDSDNVWHSPILLERMKRAGAERAGVTLFTPTDWKNRFIYFLDAFGWPGARPPGSHEAQALQDWSDLLDSLSGLDILADAWDVDRALEVLNRLASESIFQPKQDEAPVQVLGVFEASGLEFSHLWIMGMSDQAWPPRPRPNPLIPLQLQRGKEVPDASFPARQAHYRRITSRLFAAAERIVVSHPAAEGDVPLERSALLPVPTVELNAPALPQPLTCAEHLRAGGAPQMELLADDAAPPIEADLPPSGGAKLFELQALCPFRAFAELRLNSAPVEEPLDGLDAREQGILMHASLEQFWSITHSHAALVALSEAELDARIKESVRAAVDRNRARYLSNADPISLEVEVERLHLLLRLWMEVEKQRAPFTVLEAERDRTITAGEVTVKTKIDRIDELEEGGLALVDYKSSAHTYRNWLGDRPEEPQLPLYSISDRERIRAAAFAVMAPEKLGFNGIGDTKDILPGIVAAEKATSEKETEGISWRRLVERWQEVLARLGREHVSGAAAVDPKNYPATCAYCEQAPLCRIAETRFGEEGDNGDE